MEDNFELTPEQHTKLEADTRLHIADLYQQMLNGDQSAEQSLQKICDGALVYHRDHCLSPIDKVYAKNDLGFISARFEGWMLEAIDHQKNSEAFEQEGFVAGYDCSEDQVDSYIDKALAMGDYDLDHDEDFTAATVCRM